MAETPPSSISEYVEAAPLAGHSHLTQVYQILKGVAPHAEEAIKWNVPFFIEPRFLFSFSAFKAHLAFVPGPDTLEHFRKELAEYQTTTNFLKIPYQDPLPEDLIRTLAEFQLKRVRARKDDSFW
ncbi:MAG: iron chaperone [Roseibacillus sp.]